METILGRALAAGALALLLSGCARSAATPPRFSGYSRRGPIDAARVRFESTLPPGYAALGRVDARCRADDGVVAIDDESLADVDCSEALLEAALREKAAKVGGDVLVGLRCRESAERRGELFDSVLHVCFANVAMARDAASEVPAGSCSEAEGEPAWRAEEAFDIAVSLRPADEKAPPRRAASTDRVAELAVVPIGRVVMGDIVARGPDDAHRAAVRHAVRAAAGRVGATDVVGIACARDPKAGFAPVARRAPSSTNTLSVRRRRVVGDVAERAAGLPPHVPPARARPRAPGAPSESIQSNRFTS